MFNNIRLLISIIWLLTTCSSYKTDDLLMTTVESIRMAVKYYELKYSEMNLDGIFGLRIIEGQILHIKEHLARLNPTVLKHPVMSQLERMMKLSGRIATQSMEYLRKDNNDYLEKVGWVVKNPWSFGSTKFYHLHMNDRAIFENSKINAPSSNTEYISDSCIEALTKGANCHLSDVCLDFITLNNSGGYELTHQLLNMIIIDMVNCTDEVNSQLKYYRNGASILDLKKELCIKNFFEISVILENYKGNVPSHFRDLFLEELMVCPMLGFFQFLHKKWLLLSISWQNKSGCWPETINNKHLVKLNEDIENTRLGRNTLFEKILTDGCSSHCTAVAMGALTQFLRYLVLCELADICGVHIPDINFLLSPHFLPRDPTKGTRMILPFLFMALIMALLLLRYFCKRRTIMRLFVELRRLISF